MSQFLANPIIAALDVDTAEECFALADRLKGKVGGFKVGPRLMVRYGAELSRKLAMTAPVFIDNKYLDIPSTMDAAIRATFDAGATLATVHAWSGTEALELLAKTERELAAQRPFKILAVTILTSFSTATLPPPRSSTSIETRVAELADMVIGAGLTGLVCSPHEAAVLRAKDNKLILVTPGIRLESDSAGDQKRVLTPAQAIAAGSSALVIGRPIYAATDPAARAQEILSSLPKASRG